MLIIINNIFLESTRPPKSVCIYIRGSKKRRKTIIKTSGKHPSKNINFGWLLNEVKSVFIHIKLLIVIIVYRTPYMN
jgi:hypothetical protein